MMCGDVPKLQRARDELMGPSGPLTEKVEVKDVKIIEIVDVTEPMASPELGPQVVAGNEEDAGSNVPHPIFLQC